MSDADAVVPSTPPIPSHILEQRRCAADSIQLPADWPGYCEPDWVSAIESHRTFNPDVEVARADYQISLAFLARAKLHVGRGEYVSAQSLINRALCYFSADDLARDARETVQAAIHRVFSVFYGVEILAADEACRAAEYAQYCGFAPGFCYVVTNGFVIGRVPDTVLGRHNAIKYVDELANDSDKLFELDASWQVDEEVAQIDVFQLTAIQLTRIHTAVANYD